MAGRSTRLSSRSRPALCTRSPSSTDDRPGSEAADNPAWARPSKGGPPRRRRAISASSTHLSGLALPTIETIREDFAFLDDWEDRYRYVIDLGKALEPLSEAAHNETTKVRGCVSQVWIERETITRADGEAVLHFRGDSDSHLVRGLVAIAIALFSDRTPAEILAIDAKTTFRELGLEQHLTPQRSNGVRAMIERMRADALAPA
jgi:cysteine desulfuration protein SufE